MKSKCEVDKIYHMGVKTSAKILFLFQVCHNLTGVHLDARVCAASEATWVKLQL